MMKRQCQCGRETLELDPEFGQGWERSSAEAAGGWQGEVNRRSREYLRWVQRSLNRILGTRIVEDGVGGRRTRSAIRSFQQRYGLTVDGTVGPRTERALIAAGASPLPSTEPITKNSASSARADVNTPLPTSGPGYYSYGSTSRQFGLSQTIQALQVIGAAWQQANPQGPRLGIGDISLKGGGLMSPHKSHQKGVDVDIRPVRNDGREASVNYQSPSYSRALTQELVNLIRSNGVLPVRYIFFNDSVVSEVTPWPGHNDHLHVRFTGSPGDSEFAPDSEQFVTDEEGELNPWEVVYDVDPAQPFGPRWRAQRPPGLPESARLASRVGAALPYIEQLAREEMLGDVFVAVVRHLAETESGGIIARPADAFDARPPAQRPAGRSIITAWGAFQFNRDAWRSLPGVAATAFPWDSTPYDEIARPILKYAGLFSEVIGAGGSDVDAARGVRLWHRTTAGYRQYLHTGQRQGFATAWQQVAVSHRNAVDRHLHAANILESALGLNESLNNEVSRRSPDYIRWVQNSLNRILGTRLIVDGMIGRQTRSAIRSFQRQYGLAVDGVVGPQTEAALMAAGASPLPGSGNSPAPSPLDNGVRGAIPDLTPEGLIPVPGIEKTSREFREKVIRIAESLGTDPNYLMAIMSFESGLNPATRNQYSGAMGLIQFMPKTAQALGTSTGALAKMSAEQQLDYVAKYFAQYKGRLKSLEDAYMAVLWPEAIGKGRDYVLFSHPSKAYQQNSALDLNKDGRITVAEATSFVRKRLGSGY